MSARRRTARAEMQLSDGLGLVTLQAAAASRLADPDALARALDTMRTATRASSTRSRRSGGS